MRVLVTSDLHLEVTGLEPIRRLVAGMDREDPDLVVIAGDIGNPARLFEQCLAAFLRIKCPVAVLPGNHDVWTSLGETSIGLHEEILPEITRSFGFHWLEREPLVLDDGIAVCGSIGWYDYSAAEPRLGQSREEIIAYKPRIAMDAMRVDWEYSDEEFAALCRERLVRQVSMAEDDPSVERVMVVSHVPLFESQMERSADNDAWARGNAYFGHLTLGDALKPFSKVRWAVAGHTHVGLYGVVDRPGLPPIATAVVPSDYGKPRWVTLEL